MARRDASACPPEQPWRTCIALRSCLVHCLVWEWVHPHSACCPAHPLSEPQAMRRLSNHDRKNRPPTEARTASFTQQGLSDGLMSVRALHWQSPAPRTVLFLTFSLKQRSNHVAPAGDRRPWRIHPGPPDSPAIQSCLHREGVNEDLGLERD